MDGQTRPRAMTNAELLEEIRDVIDNSWLSEAGRYRQIEALVKSTAHKCELCHPK